uniref:Calpain 12 n=1 Tax=Gopherus evgoodei TaxID=1825980 RepID=A0A8C4Y7P4_9SAUR
VDVVVDDRLPVQNGELVFVRSCQSDEFWMPLLEKAYAKLNGSYEAMNGGYMNEAFVDFTGGVGETYQLKMPNPELFKVIRTALTKRSLMGAHIKVSDMEGHTPEGLVKGHAYSITGVHKVGPGKKLKLLRLRNPWGKVEWNGRWSDRSPLWAGLDPKLQKSLQVRKEDGEFWMQMDDFLRYFDALEICSLTPDLLEEEKGLGWNVRSFQGRWSTGYTAGGCRNSFWMNPQYHVRLLEPDEADLRKQRLDPSCTLLVSLMQKDRRRDRKRGKDFLPIGFEILKARNVSQRRALLPSLRAMFWTSYVPMRDVTGRYRLPPGDYLIIPSTGYPMEESSFTLRIFTEKANKEIDDEIRADMRPLQVTAFQLIYSEQSGLLAKHLPSQHLNALPRNFQHCPQRGAVFTKYDVDRSGTMNIHEMQLALDAAGFHLNHQLRETITSKYRNRYLMIDFDSFLSCMLQLEAIFSKCRLPLG